MKYLKRVWTSVLSFPLVIIIYFTHILPAIWKGDADDESWNPFK